MPPKNKEKKRVDWKGRYKRLLARERAPPSKSMIIGGAEVASFVHPVYKLIFESATPGAQPPITWWIKKIQEEGLVHILDFQQVGAVMENAIAQVQKNWVEVIGVQGVLYLYRRFAGRRRPKLVAPTKDLIGMNIGVKL